MFTFTKSHFCLCSSMPLSTRCSRKLVFQQIFYRTSRISHQAPQRCFVIISPFRWPVWSIWTCCNVMVHFNLWHNDLSLYVDSFSDAEDWFCECPPLYTGRLCQFNACERNPCGHGATCIPKSPLEAVCLCPYGRQGLLCGERKCHKEQLCTDSSENLGQTVDSP